MDTVISLADALHAAHPVLGPDWRHLIVAAGRGNNVALAALCGTALADRALALVADLREAREHARPRADGAPASPVRASTGVRPVSDRASGRAPGVAAVGRVHVARMGAFDGAANSGGI